MQDPQVVDTSVPVNTSNPFFLLTPFFLFAPNNRKSYPRATLQMQRVALSSIIVDRLWPVTPSLMFACVCIPQTVEPVAWRP